MHTLVQDLRLQLTLLLSANVCPGSLIQWPIRRPQAVNRRMLTEATKGQRDLGQLALIRPFCLMKKVQLKNKKFFDDLVCLAWANSLTSYES